MHDHKYTPLHEVGMEIAQNNCTKLVRKTMPSSGGLHNTKSSHLSPGSDYTRMADYINRGIYPSDSTLVRFVLDLLKGRVSTKPL